MDDVGAGAGGDEVVAGTAVDEVALVVREAVAGSAVESEGDAVREVVLVVAIGPVESGAPGVRVRILRRGEVGFGGQHQGVVAGAVKEIVSFAADEGVFAHAALEDVATSAADEGVVAAFSGEGVVAGFAVDDVVAGGAGEEVERAGLFAGADVVVAAVDNEVAAVGGFLEVAGQRGGRCGRGAALQADAEVFGFGPVFNEDAVGVAFLECDEAGAAVHAHNDLAGGVVFVDVLGKPGDAAERLRAELEAALAVAVGDEVGAVGAGEDVGVGAGASLKVVVFGTAVEGVVAGAAEEGVFAGVALEVIISNSAKEDVIALTSIELVVAGVANQKVVRSTAGEGVGTGAAKHEGTIVPGVGGVHAGISGLHVPVAQGRQEGVDQTLFLCGKAGVQVGGKVVVAFGIFEVEFLSGVEGCLEGLRDVGHIELEAAGDFAEKFLVPVGGVGSIFVVHLHREGGERLTDTGIAGVASTEDGFAIVQGQATVLGNLP